VQTEQINKESSGLLNQNGSGPSLKHSPSPQRTHLNRASNSKLSSKKKIFMDEARTSQSKNLDTSKKSSKKKSVTGVGGTGLDKESRD
jgi:hypothetical protein